MTTQDTDDDLERSALRKASWRILPLIGLSYAVAYMDRINIGFAAARMNADLNFSPAIYGLGAGLFFVSYALFEVPSNLLLVRFGARRWIARIMLTWGVLAVAMMLIRTPTQFYIVRFLLGLAEAGFFPGVIYYLTQWFPIAHRGRAVSRFYVALPLSSVLMGSIAGALLGLDGRLGLHGWQWLFLIEGTPAILMSLVILLWLPDRPETVSWLTPPEKAWIAGRLAAEEAAHPEAADHNIFRALTHPAVLLLGLLGFLQVGVSYAFNLSAPQILAETTGLDPTHVDFLIAGAGLVGAVTMLTNGWHSDHQGERYIHLAVPMALVAVGYALVGLGGQPLAAMAGFVLTVAGFQACNGVVWSLPGDLLAPGVIAVSAAAINTISQVGSILSPIAWGFAKQSTGSYHAGLLALPGAYLLAVAVVLVLRARSRALHRRGTKQPVAGT